MGSLRDMAGGLAVAATAIAEPGSIDRPGPRGAVPPLGYQIGTAAGILLATTTIADGVVAYRIDEVWKGSGAAFETGEPFRIDTRTHELLGYRPAHEQKVVLFFTESGLRAGSPLEVLPVVDGTMIYAPHDVSVQERLTVPQLKERVAGLVVPLRVSFIGLTSAPAIALGRNSFAPMLVLFEDHLVQRVIFKKVRKYSDIEYVDVSATDTENLDIAYTGSRFTFSAKLRDPRDFVKVLRVFERKGVRLGDRARRMLGAR